MNDGDDFHWFPKWFRYIVYVTTMAYLITGIFLGVPWAIPTAIMWALLIAIFAHYGVA